MPCNDNDQNEPLNKYYQIYNDIQRYSHTSHIKTVPTGSQICKDTNIHHINITILPKRIFFYHSPNPFFLPQTISRTGNRLHLTDGLYRYHKPKHHNWINTRISTLTTYWVGKKCITSTCSLLVRIGEVKRVSGLWRILEKRKHMDKKKKC